MNKPYINSTQVAVSVPFDNSNNGFTATDVQTAIEEVLFTRNVVPSGNKEWTVRLDQQYITFDEVFIDGTLILDGALIVLG